MMIQDLVFDDFEIIESNRSTTGRQSKKEQLDHYKIEELRPITPNSQPMIHDNKFNSVTISWKLLVTSWSLVFIASTGIYLYMNNADKGNDKYELIRSEPLRPIKINALNSVQEEEHKETDDIHGLSHCYKFVGLHTSIESINHQIIPFEGFIRDLVSYHYYYKKQEGEKDKQKSGKNGKGTIVNGISNALFSFEQVNDNDNHNSSSSLSIARYDLGLLYNWIIRELQWCFNWIPKLKSFKRDNLVLGKIREQLRLIKCNLLQIKNQCSTRRNACMLNSIFNTSKQSIKKLYGRIANIRNN
jgi:hypothetical protein